MDQQVPPGVFALSQSQPAAFAISLVGSLTGGQGSDQTGKLMDEGCISPVV